MMRDTSIKTSIDHVIGEEQWLSEELVRKMAQPPNRAKKSKVTQVLLPAAAVFFISLIGGIVFMTQSDQQDPSTMPNEILNTEEPDWNQIEAAFEDENIEKAFITYLTAILDEDYEALETISTTELVASPKELFEHYKTIDFTKYRVISVSPSLGEPITVVQVALSYQNEEQEVLKRYFIDAHDGLNIKVFEELYEETLPYTAFVFPETLKLSYEEIPEIPFYEQEFHEESVVDRLALSGTINLVTLSANAGEYIYILETPEGPYYLTTLYGENLGSVDVESFMQSNEPINHHRIDAGEENQLMGGLFLGEKKQFFGTSLGATTYIENPNQGEEDVWIIKDEGLQIIRLDEGVAKVTAVQSQIQSDAFVHFTYHYNTETETINIQSEFLEGETQATYTFTSIDELVKE